MLAALVNVLGAFGNVLGAFIKVQGSRPAPGSRDKLTVVHARLGLGLAALGRPAYITRGRADDLGADRSVEAMERRCHAMLDAAYAAGVRYVDAARSYGLAKQFLAHWLRARGIAPGAIGVGSKWGYRYVGDWRMDAAVHETKDLSAAALRRQYAESQALLGAHLRLYQIHSATVDSGVLDDRAVLDELVRLRADGIVVGLSVTGPRQADTIRKAMSIPDLFQTGQATWNLLEPSAGPALADAHARGWRVIVKEPMANGRLAAMDSTAFAAALANPWADVVLSGAVTEEQLKRGIAALDADVRGPWPSIAEAPDTYWDKRRTLAWE